MTQTLLRARLNVIDVKYGDELKYALRYPRTEASMGRLLWCEDLGNSKMGRECPRI